MVSYSTYNLKNGEIIMKKFMFLLILLSVSAAFAAAPSFRSGKIYCAEFGTTPPEILNWNKNCFGFETSQTYAAVAVKLAPKRKISIYDYALMINGVNYPCIAIKCGKEKYQYTQRAVSTADGEFCTLLFALTDINKTESSLNAALACLLPPDKSVVNIKLTNRYESELCTQGTIFKDGNL